MQIGELQRFICDDHYDLILQECDMNQSIQILNSNSSSRSFYHYSLGDDHTNYLIIV